jgi:hypothetical protein
VAAPKEIIDLIERFDLHIEAYKSGQYNETQLRREYLDPFLKSLGWDIDNKAGYAEAYKDVIHEDAISAKSQPPTLKSTASFTNSTASHPKKSRSSKAPHTPNQK